MKLVQNNLSISSSQLAEPTASDTPALRLFGLLEVIAAKDRPYSLQGLADETGWPKPTVHRMLQQLEQAGLLKRLSDGRHYGSGTRLRRLAENLLLNSSYSGAQHAVLRHLVERIGESCNLTALSGGEVVYLDRVETVAPLRFYLHPGSRVPAHCSASGKMFLSQMSAAQRKTLLGHAPLAAYTPKTITSLGALEGEIQHIKKQGYALDDEEFLPGLICAAVPVPLQGKAKYANLCIAVQAPIMRLSKERMLQNLPALHEAAAALSKIEAETTAEPDRQQ